MVTKVKEARTYSVSIVIQHITDFPGGKLETIEESVSFVTDHIDNYSMNYEAAPFWARQRIQHCIPVLLDKLTPKFMAISTIEETQQ